MEILFFAIGVITGLAIALVLSVLQDHENRRQRRIQNLLGPAELLAAHRASTRREV